MNTSFSVILGHTLNVILGLVPRIHTEHYHLLDTRDTPEYDGRKRMCLKPEYDKGLRLSTSILKHTLNVILGFIPRIHAEHYHLLDTRDTPEYDRDLMVDSRVTPEDDNRMRMFFKPENDKCTIFKGLDVVCQCAALLERRVQSGTRVRKAQAVTRQTNPIGRSMIEMLGVLAIIGVLSVGGIAGYSKAMTKFKINKTMQQIAEIATNIRTLYAQQKDFEGLNTLNAVSMGVVPDDLVYSQFYIDDDNYGSDRNSSSAYFTIKVVGLSPEVCIALATANWGNISSNGVLGVMAGYLSSSGDSPANDYLAYHFGGLVENCTEGYGFGNNYGNGYESYYVCSGNLPMSPDKAAIACKSSALEKGFGIKFTK